MRRHGLQTLLLIVVLVCGFHSSPGGAAIFDTDDRQYVSPARSSPFSAVGLVSRGPLSGRYSTGTLVDDCHVLTAQHVFGLRLSPLGKRVKFTGALGTPDQLSSEGTVIATGGLEKYSSPDQAYDARAHDWLLIRLDKCLGATLGYAQLSAWPHGVDDLSHLQSVGYPMDRKRRSGLTLDPACAARGVYTNVWFNDCATMPGNSGGPLFRLSRLGGITRLEVYAIQSAGYGKGTGVRFWRGNANQATPVWTILPSLRTYLSARPVQNGLLINKRLSKLNRN